MTSIYKIVIATYLPDSSSKYTC